MTPRWGRSRPSALPERWRPGRRGRASPRRAVPVHYGMADRSQARPPTPTPRSDTTTESGRSRTAAPSVVGPAPVGAPARRGPSPRVIGVETGAPSCKRTRAGPSPSGAAPKSSPVEPVPSLRGSSARGCRATGGATVQCHMSEGGLAPPVTRAGPSRLDLSIHLLLPYSFFLPDRFTFSPRFVTFSEYRTSLMAGDSRDAMAAPLCGNA